MVELSVCNRVVAAAKLVLLGAMLPKEVVQNPTCSSPTPCRA